MENARFAYFPNLEKILNDAEAMESFAKLNADPRVFWDLAEPHKQRLYNFIQKSMSFSTESDDVFQETLLRRIYYSFLSLRHTLVHQPSNHLLLSP